jgi:hypothetical protein
VDRLAKLPRTAMRTAIDDLPDTSLRSQGVLGLHLGA